ncbi:HpcH/HpaI aldolase/citrate lyase family protein [Roseibium sp. Sym1]|uniref:HpcH/HpaI aldolase/citrate lyase family protein n=1 Tax=Roseibium sp. Sym1 TaxID=3016006 RepID=UPI0022B52078|nr:CoA ester lyase [Roseibium sp. Sym1]
MVTSVQAPLFVPANRPERFAKAALSDADAVILDLEDAVPAAEKDSARANLAADFTDKPVLVRINAAGTTSFQADVDALKALDVAAVILPKAEETTNVTALWTALDGRVPVIALIETAAGLANARALASLEGVVRLAFGSIDYCADLGCAHKREVLLPVRSELVLASKLAGIAAPIDGVTADLADPEAAYTDAAHAKDLGMTGKLCIHPKQIDEVRRAFAPTKAECDWAGRVLASGDGAATVDGAMVDEPVRIRARAILAAASRGEAQ